MFLLNIALILAGYIIGSIPVGLIIVKLVTGKDIRQVESGRTGGTNALRAAGFWAGLATAALDIIKGASTVWLARLLGGSEWAQALAPIGAILGHNYSIFLAERKPEGGWRLRGGAGGAPCVGGSLGLQPLSLFAVLLVGVLVFFGVGVASVTTLSVALASIIFFSTMAILGYSSWYYVLYGVLALILLAWALRPNIKRLLEGNERVIDISLYGMIRARRKQGGS